MLLGSPHKEGFPSGYSNRAASLCRTRVYALPAFEERRTTVSRRAQLRAVERSDAGAKLVCNLLQRRCDRGIKTVEKRRAELNQEFKSKTHSIVSLEKILCIEDSAGNIRDIDSDERIDFSCVSTGTGRY